MNQKHISNLKDVIKMSLISSLVVGAILSPEGGVSIKTITSQLEYGLPYFLHFVPISYLFLLFVIETKEK